VLFLINVNAVRIVKSRRMRWAGHVSRMGERRVMYRVLGERHRRRLEDNIKMDLQEVGCGHGLD